MSESAHQVVDAPSVDPREAAHFERFAETWWDATGPFWPLHRLNELRVPWILERACVHFRRHISEDAPLDGLKVLDIGCGGGILSESLAALGADVLGIDVVARNIEMAQMHAKKVQSTARYQCQSAEALRDSGVRFDLILNMEVVEHVADLPGFMGAASDLLKPRGQMFIATINRNPKAWLFAIFGAEYVLRWLPRGTHHYHLLRKPSEVIALLEADGLRVVDSTGVKVNPFKKTLSLTPSLAVNYMLCASRPSYVTGSGTG